LNLLYRPPVLVQKLFGNFIWKSTNNKILLTFDDGPTEETTLKILSVLKSHKIKAVFFCVGNNIKKYPESARKILEDGHIIANHTMNHRVLSKMNRVEAIDEIKSFNELMKEKFNYNVKYFRPPHGRFNLKTSRLLNSLNLKCVMWNLLTYDFENSLKKVQLAINNYLSESSIIVFHNSIKSSDIIEASLNHTIDQAGKKGYQFGEPEDCLK
jgi:peptidoglycan/xylan/chitin deacetylase (PgdA/CDA1 family)